jgi:cellobiose-specific phosphotransferase system component IIB
MSDDVNRAIADLQSFVVCRCSPAYTGRKLRDPDCYCGYAPEVKAVAKHIQELEAKLAKAVEALKSIAYESVDEEGIYIAIYALFEIEGEKE